MSEELKPCPFCGSGARYFQAPDEHKRVSHGVHHPPAPSTAPVKDHVLRDVVNNLRDIAVQFHGTGQLRERLRQALDPLLVSPSTASEVSEPDERMIAEGVKALLGCTESELGDYDIKLMENYEAEVRRVYVAMRDALAAKSVDNCQWPTCQPESAQRQVADQVYRELYSGEAASTPAPAGAATGDLVEWERLRDPAVLHANLLNGLPAKLEPRELLHIAGYSQPEVDAALAASRCRAQGGNTQPSEPRMPACGFSALAEGFDLSTGKIAAEVDVEADRKLFEAHFTQNLGPSVGARDGASYASREIHNLWSFWLAARRTQEGAKDATDAARYRHMRTSFARDIKHRLVWYLPMPTPMTAEGLDAALDAAIAATQTTEGQG